MTVLCPMPPAPLAIAPAQRPGEIRMQAGTDAVQDSHAPNLIGEGPRREDVAALFRSILAHCTGACRTSLKQRKRERVRGVAAVFRRAKIRTHSHASMADAMSERENLEIVQRGYKAFAEGDLPAQLKLLADDGMEFSSRPCEHSLDAPPCGGAGMASSKPENANRIS